MYDVFYPLWPAVDIVIPLGAALPITPFKTYEVETMDFQPGGLANTLIAGVRIGLRILPFGLVGDDSLGSFLLEEYRKEGIDTETVFVKPGYETRKVVVLVDQSKKHSFISMNNGEMGPACRLSPSLRQCRSLCLTGYYLASPTTRKETLPLMWEAKNSGKPIFFDPGPMIPKIPRQVLTEGLSLCDYIIANDEEAALICGRTSVEDNAAALSQYTDALIVIKAGPRGCYIYSKNTGGTWHDGFQANLVDTTGAGDSFLAAFLYGILNNLGIRHTALLSNATGAAMVEKIGSGRNVPTKDEITSMLRRGGADFTF